MCNRDDALRVPTSRLDWSSRVENLFTVNGQAAGTIKWIKSLIRLVQNQLSCKRDKAVAARYIFINGHRSG